MDFTSIIGMVAAFGLMIYGMVNGHDFSVIVDNFVDIPSVYIAVSYTHLTLPTKA